MEPDSASYTVIMVCLAGGLLSLSLLWRKHREPKPVWQDPEFKRITDYLTSHLAEELSAEGVRKALNLSAMRFFAVLRRNSAFPLPQLLNRLRIEKAKELLRTTDKPIAEIAGQLGFKELFRFKRVFLEVSGQTPEGYRITG